MFEVGSDPPVWAAWAKAWKKTGPHPLVCHAIDTAAVAEVLYDVLLGPGVRVALEAELAPLGDVRRWVAFLCGLHDIGKATPIFQSMRPEVAEQFLGPEVRPLLDKLHPHARDGAVRTPHGTLTAVHLSQCLDEWGARAELRDALAYGLGGHHGHLMSANAVQHARLKSAHHGRRPWYRLRSRVVSEVARLWGLGDPAKADWRSASLSVPGMVGIAGLASVSDWIASDTDNFKYAELPLTDLDAYTAKARQNAEEALKKLRWKRWVPPRNTSYSALFGEPPRPLQRKVEELVENRTEPGVLVVEVATGEGKTRAAFQAAATLVRNLGLSGMYFALPTRATAAQVHDELANFAEALELGGLPKLVRGRLPVVATSVDEDGSGAFDPCEWFTRTRGLLFPLGVGTIDQALQAVIRSRHVFVRLTGLSGKVVVIDEAHDVDAHMTTLLRRLMWWCGRLGVPVILMSATLPATNREQLIADWRAGRRQVRPGDVAPCPAEPGGARVTWAGVEDDSVTELTELSEVNAKRPPVAVRNLGKEDLVGWLRERVSSQGCAVIIRNLVRDAEATYEKLTEEIETWEHKPKLVLLTGQVNAGERKLIEEELRKDFGPKRQARPHAIVIGTQILQHSLDLDFDVLATDLAPINELIQRLGRLHRHKREAKERVCTAPELGLLQPPEGKDGPVFSRGLHTVYHHALLLRTWSVLRGRAELKLPEEAPKLVHEVYSDPWQRLGPLRKRFEAADERMAKREGVDESRVRRFYLPALRAEDSIRELTRHPTLASRTRKDSPWKDRT
ncbi:CRISPR-associated helicase Cas3' [Saccharomonospora sp. NPDC006951]